MRMILPFVLIALGSCTTVDSNEQVDAGKVEEDLYRCAEIGWTMRIPAGWKIMSKDDKQVLNDRGYDALSKQVEIDVDSLKNLIAFSKDQFNSFLSTIEPFVQTYPGEYRENAKKLNALIYDTYVENGIQVDSSSGMESVQGKEFHWFSTRLHAPDGKVILEQRMYSRLVNGFDHGAALNFNNDADRDTLLSVWRSSVFAK